MEHFLNDKPISDSGNDFKVHKAIADTIASDIIHSEEDMDRRIALVGDWGSGKSSILSMVENNLTESDKICFFTFDLWSHAGDSLRRGFLERLDTSLRRSFKNDDDKNWDHLTSKIQSEEQTVLTIEKHDISPIVVFIAVLSAAFVGFNHVVSAFLSAIGLLGSWTDLTSIGASAAIALIAAFVFYRKAKGTFNDAKLGIADLIKNLAGYPSTQSTRTTQTEFMGSLCYEKYLMELLRVAKKHSPSGKVVIALDNLDRLAPDQAKNAWDSIQLFANAVEGHNDSIIESWILLPISMKTMESIDGETHSANESGSLSKLFIVQYEIPTPIRSEWKTSALSNIGHAFPDANSETIQYVFSVLNNLDRKINARNPRETKRLINEMVSLKRIHKAIPVESIAVYVWHKNSYLRGLQIDQGMSFETSSPGSFAAYISDKISSGRIFSEMGLPNNKNAESIHVAMMAFGVFDKRTANELLVSNLLKDDDWIEGLDVNEALTHIPSLFDSIRGCFSGVFDLDDVDSSQRLISLMRKVLDIDTSDEDNLASAKMLAKMFLDSLPHLAWPSLKSGGFTVASYIMEGGGNRTELISSAYKGAASSVSQFGTLSTDELNERIENIDAFFEKIDLGASDEVEASLQVDLGENCYDFVETVAYKKHADRILRLFDLETKSMFNNVMRGLADSAPSAQGDITVAKMLSKSRLINNAIPEVNCSDPNNIGINNSDSISRLFFEMYCIMRLGGACNSTPFVEYVIAGNRIGTNFFKKLESPQYLAAAIAYHLDARLRRNSISCDANTITPNESTSIVEGINFYLFGDSEDQCDQEAATSVFRQDAENSQTAQLSNFLAQQFISKSSQLSHVPCSIIMNHLVTKPMDYKRSVQTALLNAYSSEDITTTDFDFTLSLIYSQFYSRDPEVIRPWILKGLESISPDDWKMLLFDNADEYRLTALGSKVLTPRSAPSSMIEAICLHAEEHGWENTSALLVEKQHLRSINGEALESFNKWLTELFRNGTWKNQYSSFTEEFDEMDWISTLSSDQLLTVCETILNQRTIRHISWLQARMERSEGIILSSELFATVKTTINKIESNRKKSDPKELREYLEVLLNTLNNKRRND